MKLLKDYLHLYLGCEVLAYSTFKDGDTGQEIHIELDKTLISANSKGVVTLSGTIDANSFKLKLRHLNDMTEDEKVEILKYLGLEMLITSNDVDKGILNILCDPDLRFSPSVYYNAVPFLLSKHFDIFGLIDAGFAIDKTKAHEASRNI